MVRSTSTMSKSTVILLIGLSFLLLLNVVKVSGSGSESSEFKNGDSGVVASLVEHEVDAEIIPKESKEPKEEERDYGDYESPIDAEEILGIGRTLFIVVVVVVCVVVIGVPIICCIICGCMCFRRNKKNNTTIVVPGYQPQQGQGQVQGQHPQQGQVQIQTNNFQSPYPQQYVVPYNNNGYNYGPDNNTGGGNGQGKPYTDGYGPYNGNQKSPSPPRQQVGPNRYDQMGQYPGDPNLIPNRFKPSVPAKPGRVPGWTAVAAEVKVRNKLVMDSQSQNSPYIPPAPISPDSNMNKPQSQSYVRSTSSHSNPNSSQIQPQSQNPSHPHSHPHTHPQGYNNEAYDGGSLPQSPVPYPYSPNPGQGYNPNPNNYGNPTQGGGGGGGGGGGYNGPNDTNFMY